MKRFLFVALFVASAPALAADSRSAPTPAAAEIKHLLDHLSASHCQFERNGQWHSADEARGHLERKLRHLKKRDRDPDAEQFIRHAATGSSLSGKPYRVRCAGTRAVHSAGWFESELRRLRAAD